MPPSPTPPPPPQPPIEDATADEDALAMPSPDDDEGILSCFTRYRIAEDAAPEPMQSPSLHATNVSASPLERLASRYANCDNEVLRDVLASVGNDEEAAIALLGDAPAGTEGDAELADRLQNTENSRQPGNSRHRRNGAVVTVERKVMDEMVDTLREIVVPALRAHFEELVLPDMCETSGNVEYALREFQVGALVLPPENIIVKASEEGRKIRIHIVNVFLELEVGQWSYESKGFVPIKDAGTARMTVHGLCVTLDLKPRWSDSGGTKIAVENCTVSIEGVVRFKTSGAAADWAYNAIAVVLKPLVVSYIKDAVADTVTKALVVHLRHWALARALDEDRPSAPPPATSPQAPVTAE